MTERKLTCTWCDAEAITTIVQELACQAHRDEYHRRRRAGEHWDTIHYDFVQRQWLRTKYREGYAMNTNEPPPDDAPGGDCPEHGPYADDECPKD